MLRLYHCLTVEHDPRLLALALAICGFASLTSLVVVERGVVPGRRRLAWLLLGGAVTGLGIWTTHFAAMLSYQPGVEIRIDGTRAFAAAVVAIAISAAAWPIGFAGERPRGAVAGAIVGIALAGAHFIDMTALRIAGILTYDTDLIVAALAGGIGLCALAGHQLQRGRSALLPLRATALLGAAILYLHFVAMAGVRIVPTDAPLTGASLLGLNQIAGAVVTGSMLLLTVAFGLGYHERRIASSIVADRARLGELVEALRASEERQRLVLRATNDVIWEWDHATDLVAWSDAVETVLGYPDARRGTPIEWFFELLHPDDAETALAIYANIRTVDLPYWNDGYRVRHADGHYLHMFARGYVVRDAEGIALRSVGALLDVSVLKQVESELRWAAQHDPLTRLPNRALFSERLSAALAHARAAGRGVALSVIDLDDFKSINDGMGHAAGDALLREVARRLLEQVPAGATVARLGGDEFALIIPSLMPGDVRPETLERIVAAMTEPVVIEGRRATIHLSCGAAVWPHDGDDAEELLKSADLALYAAKAEGPNAIRSFAPSMRDAAARQKCMLDAAREALALDRIFPVYQPKVSLRTGEILGFEALLRWDAGGGDIKGPDSILAAFGDGELSVQITDRMLTLVLDDMTRWRDAGLAFRSIAINGSSVDFVRGDFARRVLDRLAAAGIAPRQLELEVTETVLLGQLAARVGGALRSLSRAGVAIALDDFGTGYASLTHLKQFPVDSIKIDRSFIARLTSGTDDAAIVAALIGLAHKLGIVAVAEGVETVEQARRLHAEGCDAAQGFLFGQPLAAAELVPTVERWCAREHLALFTRL